MGCEVMTNYLDEYKVLHKYSPTYGSSGCKYLPEVCLIIDYLKPKTVLDYGCGKANLIKELVFRYPDVEFYGYDPAIPGRDVLPVQKADLVINTDVLEHISEKCLPSVVENIASISDAVFFALHHALAYTILPNGENAHCTVKPPQWYYELLGRYFKTPYPLPGRRVHSVIITFTPSVDFLNAYHSLVDPLTKELANMKANYDSERDRRLRIKNSLSWKLTAPVRAIGRALGLPKKK
jgi:SAM-dependent methyltransferase